MLPVDARWLTTSYPISGIFQVLARRLSIDASGTAPSHQGRLGQPARTLRVLRSRVFKERGLFLAALPRRTSEHCRDIDIAGYIIRP